MILLEPFTEADFPQLTDWIDTERLLRQWSGRQFSFPLTSAQLRRYAAGTAGQTHPETLAYRVVDARTRVPVGHISLSNLNWEEKTGRISRVLVGNPVERGRGYGQAMVQSVLREAFDNLGLQRVGLGVFDFNRSALNCYEKCGFRHIGTLRHVERVDDEIWSSVEMSLAREEWERNRPAAAAMAA